MRSPRLAVDDEHGARLIGRLPLRVVLAGLSVLLLLIWQPLGSKPEIARAVNSSQSFFASADSYVKGTSPTSNFGTKADLHVDTGEQSLLRFSVSGIPSGSVVNGVTLKLYVPSNGSTVGGSVSSVSGTWQETSVTWNTKPAIGRALASLPNPVKSGTWAQANLPTTFVTGNGPFDLYVTSTSTNAVYYASREVTSSPPTLIVSWSSPLLPQDPVIVAAGDIACQPGSAPTSTMCRQKYVAYRISTMNPGAVLDLGDNQYECGSLADYNGSYNASWGKFKSITKPAVGNHEYLTYGDPTCTSANAGARGYFDYFTRAVASPLDTSSTCSTPGNPNCKGYYSYDVGTWHIIALNSNCGDTGGCNSGSPQYNWLKQDLTAHNSTGCTLAYWHIPLFSSGPRHAPNTQSLYKLLYDNNADLILTGHEHNYERFAPQDSNGVADQSRGIRQFIVGTGGANFTSFGTIANNSEFRDSSHFGIIKVTLHPNNYNWQFVATSGKVIDSGSTNCH